MLNRIILLTLLCQAAFAAGAGTGAITGRWKTIDDETGKAKAIIRIDSARGKFSGSVEKLYRDPGEDQNPLCTHCSGARKDQPEIGMTILWDLVPDGEGWGKGFILDPHNGKTYRCMMKLTDGGQKLSVRGYLGISLLGRSQVWLRVPAGER